MTRRASIAALGALFSARSHAAVGQLVPLDESAFRQMVASHRGKVLVVDFWATWCGPCIDELPKLVALHAAKRKTFDLVTVSCDEPEQQAAATQFVAKHSAPQPRYIRRTNSDDAFINAIDPQWSGALPALFLFDRGGRQVQSFVGETDLKQLAAHIETLST